MDASLSKLRDRENIMKYVIIFAVGVVVGSVGVVKTIHWTGRAITTTATYTVKAVDSGSALASKLKDGAEKGLSKVSK